MLLTLETVMYNIYSKLIVDKPDQERDTEGRIQNSGRMRQLLMRYTNSCEASM